LCAQIQSEAVQVCLIGKGFSALPAAIPRLLTVLTAGSAPGRKIRHPVYTLLMSLSLKLATAFTPLLVWGALWLLSRCGGISPTRFTPWLKTGFVVLIVVSLFLFAFDHTPLSSFLNLHAWGLWTANLWITKNGQEKAQQLLTSLNL